MSSIVANPKKKYAAIAPQRKRASMDACSANGVKKPGVKLSKPSFHKGLGDHPLWQEFADILEANRQADIAEANRLADLELEELESKK